MNISYKKDLGQQPISFIDAVKHSTLKFLKSARQFCCKKRNIYLHNTLHALSNDDSKKIYSFDKCNGIQMFSSTDYFDKLDKLILDKSKFCEISVDDNKVHPIISKENSIVKFLEKNVKHCLSTKEFSSILPSGSQPGLCFRKST